MSDGRRQDQKTIIYAPSFVNNREWEVLLPALIESGHTIIVKNHMYYDFESGALPPAGSESEYAEHVASLLDMEQFLSEGKRPNVEHIDRRSNLCELFPRADVLITDSSSASLEFLSFGLSIETGRQGKPIVSTGPCNALFSPAVHYIPLQELLRLVGNRDEFMNMIENSSCKAHTSTNDFVHHPAGGAARHAATVIDAFLFLRQNDCTILAKPRNPAFRKFQRWLQSILE